MAGDSLDIVYIGGYGRSGSTLLLRLLGALEGFLPIGELSTIWTRYCRDNQLCSCGRAFRDCEFWSAVMEDAFGGIDRVDPTRASALRETMQVRYLPMLLFPQLRTTDYQRRLSEYVDMLEALYRALQRASGCVAIIDSSKRPAHALALGEIPGARVKMVHLIRDSRACAFSWQRRKRQVEQGDGDGGDGYMYQLNVLRTAIEWDMRQIAIVRTSRRFALYAPYRYEDMVREPRRVLVDMANRLGVDEPAFPFVSDDAVTLGPDHSLWGNPSRFENGVITIRGDDQWRTDMEPRKRRAVSVFTFPLLQSFGYLGTASTGPDAVISPLASDRLAQATSSPPRDRQPR